MPRVRNLMTGLDWDVPAGHYSLADPNFEVLPDPEPEPAPVKRAAPKKK